MTIEDKFENYNRFHYDKRKCYATATVEILKHHELPIFSIFDNVEQYKPPSPNLELNEIKPLKCGLYLVNEFVISRYNKDFVVQTQWMPHFEVQYYLDNDYFNHDQIALQYQAHEYLSGEVLSNFVKFLFETFGEKYGNMLWHHFYGAFATKRIKKSNAFITTDFPLALAYFNEHYSEVSIKPINDEEKLWLVQRKLNERLEMDNLGLYTCVMGGGRMQLLEMLETIWIPFRMELVGVRTDSIYLHVDDTTENDEAIEFRELMFMGDDSELEYWENLRKHPYRKEDEWNPPSQLTTLRIKKIDTSKYDLEPLKMEPFKIIQTVV